MAREGSALVGAVGPRGRSGPGPDVRSPFATAMAAAMAMVVAMPALKVSPRPPL